MYFAPRKKRFRIDYFNTEYFKKETKAINKFFIIHHKSSDFIAQTN